jgi:hypothetical protein
MDSSYCTMTKHYILTLNPNAKHDWDRCSLREPLTAKRADLAKLIADAIEEESGSYLVCVNIEVTILEKASLPQVEQLTLNLPEISVQSAPQELVA